MSDQKCQRSAQRLLVCPQCHGPLVVNSRGAACRSCKRTFDRRPEGFLDLRVDASQGFGWSPNEEAATRWLSGAAPIEAAGAQHVISSYLTPLFTRLGLADSATVLPVGCGGGWDVETLHKEGFLAWGIDIGGRVMVWKDRSCVDFLSMSDALYLPFPDSAFDFVFSDGVIEHIAEDWSNQRRDWQIQQRRQFAESLLRVTKPGGYILVTCPNRLFPIDFFHGGKLFHRLQMHVRLHSPFETLYLLSYGDIKYLFQAQAEWIKPLSLKRFFNLRRLAGGSRLKALGILLIEFSFGLIPDVFWGTAFSPYLVILIEKTAKA